jgi:hypothetical protein
MPVKARIPVPFPERPLVAGFGVVDEDTVVVVVVVGGLVEVVVVDTDVVVVGGLVEVVVVDTDVVVVGGLVVVVGGLVVVVVGLVVVVVVGTDVVVVAGEHNGVRTVAEFSERAQAWPEVPSRRPRSRTKEPTTANPRPIRRIRLGSPWAFVPGSMPMLLLSSSSVLGIRAETKQSQRSQLHEWCCQGLDHGDALDTGEHPRRRAIWECRDRIAAIQAKAAHRRAGRHHPKSDVDAARQSACLR